MKNPIMILNNEAYKYNENTGTYQKVKPKQVVDFWPQSQQAYFQPQQAYVQPQQRVYNYPPTTKVFYNQNLQNAPQQQQVAYNYPPTEVVSNNFSKVDDCKIYNNSSILNNSDCKLFENLLDVLDGVDKNFPKKNEEKLYVFRGQQKKALYNNQELDTTTEFEQGKEGHIYYDPFGCCFPKSPNKKIEPRSGIRLLSINQRKTDSAAELEKKIIKDSCCNNFLNYFIGGR